MTLSGQGVYCRTCTDLDLYHRKLELSASETSKKQICAVDDCDEEIAVGGKSGKLCSRHKAAHEDARQKEIAEAGRSDPNARDCATDGCSAKAPVGGGSRYCDECYKENRRKRRRKK